MTLKRKVKKVVEPAYNPDSGYIERPDSYDKVLPTDDDITTFYTRLIANLPDTEEGDDARDELKAKYKADIERNATRRKNLAPGVVPPGAASMVGDAIAVSGSAGNHSHNISAAPRHISDPFVPVYVVRTPGDSRKGIELSKCGICQAMVHDDDIGAHAEYHRATNDLIEKLRVAILPKRPRPKAN